MGKLVRSGIGILVLIALMVPASAGPAIPGLPAYYPADYGRIIEASKAEGKLLVYSIMSARNWAPVLAEFKKLYPWLDVETLDLGSYEVFERYYAESASGARTADMIISIAPDAWQEFLQKGQAVTYESPESRYIPSWAKFGKEIYMVSADPMVFIWNKRALRQELWPKSMAQLAELVQQNPQTFRNRLTTYDAERVATGFAINWFWIKRHGERGWRILETLARAGVRAQSSAGRMIDSVLSGESIVGYFVSTISVFPRFPAAEPVLGWGMIEDGTPVANRGMAITRAARSPNAARLMLDFILSQSGQIAFAEGGLTAYRPDVAGKAKHHLTDLAKTIGERNLIIFSYDRDLMDKAKREAFLARWKKIYQR